MGKTKVVKSTTYSLPDPRSQNFVSSDFSIKSGTQFGRRGGLEEQSSSLAGD